MATAKKYALIHRAKVAPIPRFGDVAEKLVENGFAPVPLYWSEKRPVPDDWTRYTFNPRDIRGAVSYRNRGTGILCGHVVGLDVDVYDPAVAAEIERLADELLGGAPRRIGQAPKVLRVYRTEVPFGKITSAGVELNGRVSRVEVLGAGQQFVAFNVHPETEAAYAWNGAGDPLTVKAADLPVVTERQMREFVAACDAILARAAGGMPSPAPLGGLAAELARDAEAQASAFERDARLEAEDPDACRSAIAAIPNADVDYDRYVAVGHAIAGALGAAGRDAWHGRPGRLARVGEPLLEVR